jgi:hypothetical protein
MMQRGFILDADRKDALKKGRGKTPIAWHPLFPAMVAVWFGALFGLGALAVRASLLERIAVASGIDLLIPAAAPPLGVNARILIALGLAFLGGIIGLTTGSLMARSKPSAQARRAERAAAKAAQTEAEMATPIAQRPASGAFGEAAEMPSFIDISQLNLDEGSPVEFVPGEAETFAEIDLDAPPAHAKAEPAEAAPKPARRPDPAYFPLPDSFPVPGGAAAQRLMAADLDDLSHVELIERLALSLQRRRGEAMVHLDAASAEALREPLLIREFEVAEELPVSLTAPVPSYYPPAPKPASREGAFADDTAASVDPAPAQYSSLLGIARPAQAKLVALVPDAPGTAAAALRQDPVATERALRDALSALQRMSGAA